MANTGFKGISVRQTTDRLLFDAFYQDYAGDIVTAGTATLYLYELQSTGNLSSFDFNTGTFKTTALTTETISLAHRTGNNSTTNTGLWTCVVSGAAVSGFTKGAIYYARTVHASGSPTDQVVKFQFGDVEGDMLLNSRYHIKSDVAAVNSITVTGSGTEAIPRGP